VAKIRIGKECKPLTGRTFAQLLAGGGQRDPTAGVVAGASEANLDSVEVDNLRKIIQLEAQNSVYLGVFSAALCSRCHQLPYFLPDAFLRTRPGIHNVTGNCLKEPTEKESL